MHQDYANGLVRTDAVMLRAAAYVASPSNNRLMSNRPTQINTRESRVSIELHVGNPARAGFTVPTGPEFDFRCTRTLHKAPIIAHKLDFHPVSACTPRQVHTIGAPQGRRDNCPVRFGSHRSGELDRRRPAAD